MNINELGNQHTAAAGDWRVAAGTETRQADTATSGVHILALVISCQTVLVQLDLRHYSSTTMTAKLIK